MSIEDRIRRNKELYENRKQQLEEEERYKIEREKKEELLKKEREQREKEYQIKRLENIVYTIFEGDVTGFKFLGKLFVRNFSVRVGDFEYEESEGGGGNPHTGGGGCGVSIYFSYKGIKTEHYPFWASQKSFYYFPDWNLTLSANLIDDIRELAKLK